jgi:glycolate oxidase
LEEAVEFALQEGGVPWKPTVNEQRKTMNKMDPNTLNLLKDLKRLIDPNGIMNPGNWEVS